VDVEPHATNVIAEDVVVVGLALGRNGAQVRHGQVASLFTVQLMKIVCSLPERYTNC
jgi:hypothetical protein